MLDAEIAEGDVAAVTQAIQNALRAPAATTVVKRLAAPAAHFNGATDASEPDMDEGPTIEETTSVETLSEAPKQRAPRKPAPKPNVIEIDVASEPPLSSLVDPGSNHRRYLAIAAWLHDHRKIEVINADHIYTCYRHLRWPIDILDFAQPLRELKHKQFFTSPERGKYAINQLGLAKAGEAGSD
jgi:hypothetical protein